MLTNHAPLGLTTERRSTCAGYMGRCACHDFVVQLAGAGVEADPKNPLTARVRVNRIWSRLFGRGLVGSVDDFGKMGDAIAIPNLIDIQRASYHRFLQEDANPMDRETKGLQALLTEIFPIVSYDKSMELEYVAYELEPPRYSILQCRQLRLTYGHPLKIRCRLKRKEADDIAEQAIYLGEIPKMISGMS